MRTLTALLAAAAAFLSLCAPALARDAAPAWDLLNREAAANGIAFHFSPDGYNPPIQQVIVDDMANLIAEGHRMTPIKPTGGETDELYRKAILRLVIQSQTTLGYIFPVDKDWLSGFAARVYLALLRGEPQAVPAPVPSPSPSPRPDPKPGPAASPDIEPQLRAIEDAVAAIRRKAG